MASNPIQGSDLVDVSSVKAEFAKLIALYGEAKKELLELAKVSREALNVKGNTAATTKAVKEQAEQVDKLSNQYDELKKSEKELIKIEQELLKTQQQSEKVQQQKIKTEKEAINLLATKERRDRALLKEEERLTKQAKKLDEITKKQSNTYAIQSKKLNDLRLQYKNLVLNEGSASKAAKKLRKEVVALDSKLKKLDASVGQNQRSVGKYSNALKGAAGAFIGPLGIAGAITLTISAFKGILNITREFEVTMSTLKAISGATGKEFADLEGDALRLGKSTSFTSSEVGKLQVEFAKLGFSTKEILNATEATLNLAKVAKVDLAEAATVAGSTIRAFGLDANQTQRVVDVMAKSFSTSALDMSKFSTAMAIVAPVAKNAGFSIEETSGFLAVLADNGIDASTSGSALRNIFLDIAKEGITLEEALGRINSSTVKNVEALTQFGKRGATVASVMADQQEKAAGLTEQFLNAAGAAEEMARIMEDNLDGSLKKLSSAFEGLILNEGGDFNDFIRSVVDGLTVMIRAIEGIDTALEVFDQQLKQISSLGFADFNLSIEAATDLFELFDTESGKSVKSVIGSFKQLDDASLKSAGVRGFYIQKLEQEGEATKAATELINVLFDTRIKELKILEEESNAVAENTDATEDNTDSTKENADANKKNAKEIAERKKQLKLLNKELLAESAALKEVIKNRDLSDEVRIAALEEATQKEIEAARALFMAGETSARQLAAIKLKLELQLAASIKNIRDQTLDEDQKRIDDREKRIKKNVEDEIKDLQDFNKRAIELKEAQLKSEGKTAEEIAFILFDEKIARLTQEASILKRLGVENTKEQEDAIALLRLGKERSTNEKIRKAREELNELIKSEAFNLAESLVDFQLELTTQARDAELQSEQEKLDTKTALLDQQLSAGLISEEQALRQKETAEAAFREKEKVIQEDQAKAEKRNAVFKATINAIAAVIEAGVITPLAILTGIFAAAQIALLVATPIPKFKEGGIYDPETGLIGGQSHAAGGTKFYDKNGSPQFEAQKGEKLFVIKDKAVPFYDWINSQTKSDVPDNFVSSQSGSDYKVINAIKGNKNVNINNARMIAELTGMATAKHMSRKNYYDARYG